MTVQSYSVLGTRIQISPDNSAPPNFQIGLTRVTPTVAEGFFTYRSSVDEPIVTWPFPMTTIATIENYMYLFFVDGGRVTIERIE